MRGLTPIQRKDKNVQIEYITNYRMQQVELCVTVVSSKTTGVVDINLDSNNQNSGKLEVKGIEFHIKRIKDMLNVPLWSCDPLSVGYGSRLSK